MKNISVFYNETAETVNYIIDDSYHTNKNNALTGFSLLVGYDSNNEPLFIPYVASTKRERSNILNLFQGLTTANSTLRGVLRGAEDMSSGSKQMANSALKGGGKGFLLGISTKIVSDILTTLLTDPDHYISHTGVDIPGPIYLNK